MHQRTKSPHASASSADDGGRSRRCHPSPMMAIPMPPSLRATFGHAASSRNDARVAGEDLVVPVRRSCARRAGRRGDHTRSARPGSRGRGGRARGSAGDRATRRRSARGGPPRRTRLATRRCPSSRPPDRCGGSGWTDRRPTRWHGGCRRIGRRPPLATRPARARHRRRDADRRDRRWRRCGHRPRCRCDGPRSATAAVSVTGIITGSAASRSQAHPHSMNTVPMTLWPEPVSASRSSSRYGGSTCVQR